MSESDTSINIPSMIGLEALTRIIVAYYKAGADELAVTYRDVSQLANVSLANVRRNAPFFEYIGLLEGDRPMLKLSEFGKDYAQSLNWGRIKDAGNILGKELKNNNLVSKILGYVDINKPVIKNDLVAKIAMISNVPNEPRYRTGINGLIDMLVSANLLKETENGIVTSEKKITITADAVLVRKESPPTVSVRVSEIPIQININMDASTVDSERLKQIIQIIKEVLSESE